MLALTENAVSAVRKVLETSDEVVGLRIMVATGGCSGFRYQLGLDNNAQDGDQVLTFDDVTVYVDAESQPLLAGCEIDFVEDLTGSGFIFNNPNAQSKCGCGKSFSC